MENDKEKTWKNIEKMALIITTLAAILAIIGFFSSSESVPTKNYEVENNDGAIVDENNGTINFNYLEENDDNISLIREELLDLSYAGIYPVSMEGMVNREGNIYYKKGAVIDTEFENKSNNSKIITDIDFVIDNIAEIEYYEVDFVPIDFEDGISIYATNNGNVDIENSSVKLGTTFNDIWDEKNDINFETMNSLKLELSHGEVSEIYQYSYADLLKIFNGGNKSGWLHVFIVDTKGAMINFEPFICNIVCDDLGIYSIINQGGDGQQDNIIPIFLDGKTQKVEIVNNHPEINSHGVTQIQFLVLPNQSMKIDFHIDIVFNDNTKVESERYTANFLVPIYDDANDYLLLREAIMKSKSKRMIYGREENIDSSFLYNPKKLYDNLCE